MTKKKNKVDSEINIKTNCINKNRSRSRNFDFNKNFEINNIIQKTKIRNSTFYSKKNDKQNFLNTNINIERISIDTNNNFLLKNNELKNNIIYNYKKKKSERKYNNSQIKRNKKNSNDFKRNKRAGKDIYLKFKTNKKNINIKNKSIDFNNDISINFYDNTKICSTSRIRNYKKYRIKKSRSIDYDEDKNKNLDINKKMKHNFKIHNSNIKTDNCSKKIIIKNFILNTQKDYNNRRIKNREFNFNNNSTLIKFYEDLDLNTQKMVYNSIDSNKNDIIYTHFNNNNNKFIPKKQKDFLPFDLNNIIIIDNKDNLILKINKELESNKIKYYIKNNKYLCLKNEQKLIFEINELDEKSNCFIINISMKRHKNNILNFAFWQEFINNIINQNSSNT